jgi:quercetin dioxygenase-like cupin family protein
MKSGFRSTWFCAAIVGSVCGMGSASADAPAETVSRQFAQVLANAPGKSFTTLLVSFPPGARAVPHRHGQAFVYAYVLEGAVRSQLDDAVPRIYRAGEDWSEAPGAHHVLTENASATLPARLLVVFVAESGAALKVPDSRSKKTP